MAYVLSRIIRIDGCFLKNNVKRQLLSAIERDANNQNYHVAWVVVQVENTDSWLWFITKLKVDLNLGDGDGFTLLSDRQKGLILAVEEVLPRVEHLMSARHVYGNLRRIFPGKSRIKGLFWAVVKIYNIAEYEAAIEAVKSYDISVYEAMMMKNLHNFSRAFFTNTSTYEDVSNSFSESYNSAIDKAQEMPLVEMLKIRRQSMDSIDMPKNKALNHTRKYSLKVAETIAEEEIYRMFCQTHHGPNKWYDVILRMAHPLRFT